LLILTFLEIQ